MSYLWDACSGVHEAHGRHDLGLEELGDADDQGDGDDGADIPNEDTPPGITPHLGTMVLDGMSETEIFLGRYIQMH